MELRFCERCQAVKGFLNDAEFARLSVLIDRAKGGAWDRKPDAEKEHETRLRAVCEEYTRLTGVAESNWINVLHHWDQTLRGNPDQARGTPA